jgi:N-acetylmuramoyl-L-alanine amidase
MAVLLYAFQKNKLNPNQSKGRVKTVVIDPGHGGHDSGCHGSSAYEKHVALSVSLKLGKLIEQYFPDVKVIYTRKTDVFVELYRRAQIANENKADLFICIHCNSGPKTAYGAETFVMGLHKTADNLAVARRENAVILKEDNYQRRYDGFDPNSPEANIIFSLYQNAYLNQSLFFADKVQHEFKHHAKRHNRGVKQAGFLVIYKTAMPSVLIETGFLTNHEEEIYLKSEFGQSQMATSIVRAFNQYKNWIEGTKNALPNQLDEDVKPPSEIVVKTPETPSIVVENQPNPENEKDEKALVGEVVYRVQVFSSPTRISLSSKRFQGTSDAFEYKHGQIFKYTVGRFSTFDQANAYLSDAKKNISKDAFVVAFRGQERISVSEARALTNTQP